MMQRDYHNPAFRQLGEAADAAPRELKLVQAARAEKLITELDPTKTYSYAFLCSRIVDDRPKHGAKFKVTGDAARHDLRLFVEDVSDSANVDANAAGEHVWTVDELSHRFKVSTKTIARWRDLGLVSRRFVFQGRKRVGFLQSSVEQFVRRNHERVRRGAGFSQLTSEERSEIIHRAKGMAKSGGCPSEVARRLAEQLDRSVETIRYTIKHYDAKHPHDAVFPGIGGPLTDEAKRTIFHSYCRGTSVDALAKQYCRTKPSIYRVINEMRGRQALALPLDYMPNEEFLRPAAAEEILAPMPSDGETKKSRPPAGLPPYLASLYETPLLTREQERHLFRQFNFLKHQAQQLRNGLLDARGEFDPSRAKCVLLDKIESLYDEIVHIKNEIVRHNLRLVVSIAKRHVGMSDNFFELVSDGNMSLIRAAEKFDYARGNKFSTYASWAIMKNFARTIPLETRQRDRFRTSQGEIFNAREDLHRDGALRSDEFTQLIAQSQHEDQVRRMLRRLDDREQQIIKSRFGLGGAAPQPLTLKEVGDAMGVTKERVRQIEARALKKLLDAAREEKITLDDLN